MLSTASKATLIAISLLWSAGPALQASEPAHGDAHAAAPADAHGDGHGDGHADDHAKPAVDLGHLTKIRELPKDFLLPAKLWDELLQHEVKAPVASLPDEPGASTMSSVLFSSVIVTLTEKNPGILKEPVLSFEFPKGGGEIDLSQWTTGKVGTFFVRFSFPFEAQPPTFEAYHLSKARKRRVEGRIYGGGCKFFYKITQFLQKQKDGRGMAVNTTKDFHASTLGGHFLFSWQDQEAVQVTQVRFTSSNNPELFCENVPKTPEATAEAAAKPNSTTETH